MGIQVARYRNHAGGESHPHCAGLQRPADYEVALSTRRDRSGVGQMGGLGAAKADQRGQRVAALPRRIALFLTEFEWILIPPPHVTQRVGLGTQTLQ